MKNTFKAMIASGEVPNLMLCGPPGVGKTSVAKALLNEMGSEFITPNGSLEVNKEKIRTDIADFASARSMGGGRRYVIIDEADGLPSNVQEALRNFTETFSKNCGFIFTCNYKHKIDPTMHSRFSIIEFGLSRDQKTEMAALFYKRLKGILAQENVKYEPSVVQELLIKHFPDYRRVLNELQRYSATGEIDTGILSNYSVTTYKKLIGDIKKKDFTSIRKWVGENQDHANFYTDFYKHCTDGLDPVNLAQLILILGKYSAQHAIATDPEINVTACLVETMLEVDFK